MQWIVEKVKSLLYYGSCTILLIVVAGLLLLFFFQNSLIYMPGTSTPYAVIPGMSRYPHENPQNFRDPKSQGLDYEDVHITTSDNVQLHGWFIPSRNKEIARTVIYYHENAGNIGFRISYLKIYSRSTESNILLVAYRGYSNSGGVPSENGIKLDGQAILNYAMKMQGIDKTKIYIHGRSLGGAVAVHVASKIQWGNVRGVILENTFTSMSDMVDVVFGRLKHVKHLLLRNYWRSIDKVAEVKAPILFMKAALDELVPLTHMNKLADAAKSHGLQVQQYVMEGATHNQTWQLDPQGYFGRLVEFFSGCESITVGIKHARSMPSNEISQL